MNPLRLWKQFGLVLLALGSGCAAARLSADLIGSKIVANARVQLGWNTVYDPSYVKLGYPGGDVPKDRGVCTDVVSRSLRAVGKDLQKLVYEDKSKNVSTYPVYPGKTIDRNIDHRRCPNLLVFFKRFGSTLTTKTDSRSIKQWKPGDIVFWKLDNGRDHVGIVTDKVDGNGVPFAIHNLSTTLEEPVLNSWKIVGHFRYPKR
jgi:uncharacterized protein YijF (DUF1287 family)